MGNTWRIKSHKLPGQLVKNTLLEGNDDAVGRLIKRIDSAARQRDGQASILRISMALGGT